MFYGASDHSFPSVTVRAGLPLTPALAAPPPPPSGIRLDDKHSGPGFPRADPSARPEGSPHSSVRPHLNILGCQPPLLGWVTVYSQPYQKTMPGLYLLPGDRQALAALDPALRRVLEDGRLCSLVQIPPPREGPGHGSYQTTMAPYSTF